MTPGPAPLRGLRVLVTRRPEQARELIDGLAVLGATVTAIPLIETLPPDDPAPLLDALARLSRYDWVAFTSANAVEAVVEHMDDLGLVLPTSLRVASVGRATSAACRSLLGRAADLEPASDFRAEGLVAAFAERSSPSSRILLPVSSRARNLVEARLSGLGHQVDRIVAYRTETPPESAGRLREAVESGLDLVVFASPSAVTGFVDALGAAGRSLPVAVIGPTTAGAAAAAGLDVRVNASPSTTEGLVGAIAGHYACR